MVNPTLGIAVLCMSIVIPMQVKLLHLEHRSNTAQYKARKMEIKLKTPCLGRQKTDNVFMKDCHENNFYRDGEAGFKWKKHL